MNTMWIPPIGPCSQTIAFGKCNDLTRAGVRAGSCFGLVGISTLLFDPGPLPVHVLYCMMAYEIVTKSYKSSGGPRRQMRFFRLRLVLTNHLLFGRLV